MLLLVFLDLGDARLVSSVVFGKARRWGHEWAWEGVNFCVPVWNSDASVGIAVNSLVEERGELVEYVEGCVQGPGCVAVVCNCLLDVVESVSVIDVPLRFSFASATRSLAKKSTIGGQDGFVCSSSCDARC